MSVFAKPWMDLIHGWRGDSYWSKILHGTVPTLLRDLKVKVTHLEFICKSFALKFLQCQFLQSL